MPGVVFDLDGVLLDSEELHYRAYNTVLRRFDGEVDRHEYALHWIAEGNGPEYAVERYRLPISAAELRAAKALVYTELLAREAQLMPGVREALARLSPYARLAIATNSSRSDVAFVLQHFSLNEWFFAVVVREDYAQAKPAPDAYREAVRRLALPPTEILVVEDSPRGVRAAQAAGLVVVAVPNAFTRYCAFPAHVKTLASLDALTWESVRSCLELADSGG